MNADDEIHWTKLPNKSNPNSEFIVKIIWSSNSITIQLLIHDTTDPTIHSPKIGYEGTITIDLLKSFANHLEIPFEDFLKETKDALCTNKGLPNFTYEWNAMKFIWRKVRESGLKIIYGSVVLIEQPNLCETLLIETFNNNVEQKMEINRLSGELKQFKIDHELFKKSYEQLVDTKNQIEDDLLTRFVALLNSKKDKIVELQTELEVLTDKFNKLQTSHNIKGKAVIPLSSDDDTNDSDVIPISAVEQSNIKSINQLSQSPESSPVLMLPKRRRANIMPDHQADTNVPGCSSSIIQNVEHLDEQNDPYNFDTEKMIEDM